MTLHTESVDAGAAASVELAGIGKRYGDAWAVRGLDLGIRAGEFVSLLGPSGCGKTTTLRMIGGRHRARLSHRAREARTRRRCGVSAIVATAEPTAARAAARAARPGPRRRRPLARTLLTVWGVLGLLFLFLPVLVMVVYSFNTGRSLGVFRGFGLTAFTDALADPAVSSSVGVSIVASLGAAVLSTVLGTLAGIALGRRPGPWAPALTLVLALVLVTPDIVNAVSLLPWYVTLGVDLSLPAFNNGVVRLVVADSLYASTIVTFVVRSRVEGMDAALEEAAADLYAPPLRRFVDVTLPLIRPAVVSGALLAFTVSPDETVIASFVSVAGSTPWPVYVFSALKTGLRPAVAAMSTLLLLLTLAALAAVIVVLRRSGTAEVGGTVQLARNLVG